jgi:hypothetical protein
MDTQGQRAAVRTVRPPSWGWLIWLFAVLSRFVNSEWANTVGLILLVIGIVWLAFFLDEHWDQTSHVIGVSGSRGRERGFRRLTSVVSLVILLTGAGVLFRELRMVRTPARP